jgi:hypothetical protein
VEGRVSRGWVVNNRIVTGIAIVRINRGQLAHEQTNYRMS